MARLIIRYNTSAGATLPTGLTTGELAVNIPQGRLFVGSSLGTVELAGLSGNTFTVLNRFLDGITTSSLYSSLGSTFGSTLQVNGGATFAGTTDHTGVARFAAGSTFSGLIAATAGITTSSLYSSLGSTFGSTLQVNGGSTFAGIARFASSVFVNQVSSPASVGITMTSGTKGNTGNTTINPFGFFYLTPQQQGTALGSIPSVTVQNVVAAGTTYGKVTIDGADLFLGTITTDGVNFVPAGVVLSGDPLIAGSQSRIVSNAGAARTVTIPDATGTFALNTTLNSFSVLQTFTSGISAAGGVTLASTLQVNGGATFAGTTDHTGVARFAAGSTFSGLVTTTAGITTTFLYSSTGSTFGGTLQVNGGATFAGTTNITGTANISGALNSTGLFTTTGGLSASGGVTFNTPIVSTRLSRTSSGVFDTRTGSFSPAESDNGKIFVINISGKTTATVTLDGLSVGWRAKFLVLGGSGVSFTSTSGTVFGSFGTGGLGNAAISECVEVHCYATNAYHAS